MPGKTNKVPNEKAPTPTPQPNSPNNKIAEPDWLVMIYMAADNNLAEECVFSLTEIQRVAPSENVAVVAQFDSRVKGIATKRYDFNKKTSGQNGARLCEAEDYFPEDPFGGITPTPPVTTMTLTNGQQIRIAPTYEVNSASAEVLKVFILDSIKKYPKARTLLILSGHGSGTFDGFLSDTDPQGSLSIPNLGTALDEVRQLTGKKIDILGMDSCLMSMIEVCHQVSSSVDFLVGSEGFVLSGGWPYREILELMATASQLEPQQLAEKLVETYIGYYSGYVNAGISVDQSASDLRQSQAVASAVKDLVAALTKEIRGSLELRSGLVSDLIVSHWRAQSYEFEQFVDLKDFCLMLQKETKDHVVDEKCGAVIRAIDSMVKVFGYSGGLTQHSNGLSIYFPWAKSELGTIREYHTLRFAQASDWDLFLSAYVKGTQREMRETPTKFQRGVGTLIPVTPYLNTPSAFRTSNAAGTKTSNAAGTKTSNPAGTKTSNPAGTKSVVIVVPAVKNPPDQFIDYENNCQL